jgi:hypothetical protein
VAIRVVCNFLSSSADSHIELLSTSSQFAAKCDYRTSYIQWTDISPDISSRISAPTNNGANETPKKLPIRFRAELLNNCCVEPRPLNYCGLGSRPLRH